MIVLVAGAGGRLGRLLVKPLIARGHAVRGLVRTAEHAPTLEAAGAQALVADLRGDIEWAVEGCDAVIFAAGAHRRAELGAVDAGGAAKLAEAANHYDARRFVLCSAIGADAPDPRPQPVRDFLAAKWHAEQRLEQLDLPWTILRFGRLTDEPARGRITTTVNGRRLVIGRKDAAATIVASLDRPHLERRIVEIVEGDRHIGDALDLIEPAPLPPSRPRGLGVAQSLNAPPDPDMLFPDAAPLDVAVDFEGDGDPAPEVLGNDDPSPGIP